jgi:hypothetical protein
LLRLEVDIEEVMRLDESRPNWGVLPYCGIYFCPVEAMPRYGMHFHEYRVLSKLFALRCYY